MLRVVSITMTVATVISGLLLIVIWNLHRNQANQQEQDTTRLVGSTGTDFKIKGKAVRGCVFIFPKQLRPGDSLSVILRLEPLDFSKRNSPPCDQPLAANASPDNLGDVSSGTVTPALVAAADCATTQPQGRHIAATQDLRPFVWLWSVDCKSEGNKALQVYLTSDDGGKGSDLLNFEQLKYFSVSDSLPQQMLTIITGAGSILSVVSGVFALIRRPGVKT